MSPEYFHERLTFGEADDYLAGLARRYYHGYDQARMITTIIGKLFAKNYQVPSFPWEKKEPAPAASQEELDEIMQEAHEWEARLNKK